MYTGKIIQLLNKVDFSFKLNQNKNKLLQKSAFGISTLKSKNSKKDSNSPIRVLPEFI